MRVLRESERKFVISGESSEKVCVLVGRLPQQGSANHTIAFVELQAGLTSEKHFHSSREESYLILEGSGEANIDGENIAVAKGDLVSTKPNESHQFRASFAENLKYLVITAPTWIPEDSHPI